jgi:hypothetical protein
MWHAWEVRDMFMVFWRKYLKEEVTYKYQTCEDNIKMDLQEVGWSEGIDWVDRAHDRDRWWAPVNAVMSLPFP